MGKKRAKISLLILCLLITFVPSVVFASSENWVEVITFEGNESARTKSFFCDFPEWRIVAKYIPSIHAHHFFDMFDFSVNTYQQGDDANPINTIDLDSGGWTEFENGTTVWTNMRMLTSSVLNNVGVFYIKIDAGLIDSYSVAVEQNTNSVQESEKKWVEVVRFNGTIWPEYTERFRIDCFDWRINWSITPKTSDTIVPLKFRLDVKNASGYIVEFFLASFQISGTLNMNQTGEYYLYIDPMHAENYSIIIEQNMNSIPEFPSLIIVPFLIVGTSIFIIIRKNLSKKRNLT